MRIPFVVLLLAVPLPMLAQVQSRPTDPPIVTAENESWYQLREPIQFAGDVYYPAGPVTFFNGNTMVRTGRYNGVLLYADTTLEPYSVVFAPIGRGLMQPYERPRRGTLAGTNGSRLSSFPVAVGLPASAPPAAAFAPTALPLPVGAMSAYTPETRDSTPSEPIGGVRPLAQAVVRSMAPSPAPPVATIRRPESNDGVWIRFANRKWVSAGQAVPLRPSEFTRVGQHSGADVYSHRDSGDSVIYLTMADGVVAPFRRQ